MDHQSKSHLYTRSRFNVLHDTSLRNESSRLSGDLGELTDNIFVHLPANYEIGEPKPFPETEIHSTSSIPSREWISHHFYKNYYCDVEVKRGYGGKTLEIDEFVEEITKFGASARRNTRHFLQGGIGSGKTAFINYIISEHGWRLFNERDVWFLRVNVDVLDFSRKEPVAEKIDHVYSLFCKKLRRVIQKLIDGDYLGGNLDSASESKLADALDRLRLAERDDAENPKSDFYDSVEVFSSIIEKRLLIIVDNLDGIFHENDRYTFVSNIDTAEAPYLEFITCLVEEFNQNGQRSADLGANVLFVLRPDSYERMKAAKILDGAADSSFSDNKNLYSLSVADWDAVVEKRVDLIRSVIAQVRKAGKRQEISESMEPVLNALVGKQKRERLIQHLRHLSSFGLRSVMRFLRQYTWLNVEGDESEVRPVARYLDQVPVGLVCFMLDGKRLYSQKESNFPNLYFCNVEPDEEELTNTEIAEYTKDVPNMSSSHGHSYWIKTLLLSFIRARNERQESIRTQDIIDVFAREGDGYYHNSLVRLSLGSFSQTNVSNLVDVSRELSADQRRLVVSDVRLTPRAEHCLDHIFSKFSYLQLVIDDFSLPLPRTCAPFFKYDQEIHYGYLVRDDREYSLGARQMIVRKARQVSKFLSILTLALECEKLRYHRAFSNLEGEGVPTPDLDTLKQSVFDEFSHLGASRGINIGEIQSLYDGAYQDLRGSVYAAYGIPS